MKNVNIQKDTESVKEQINQTLKKIHRKMVESFNISFTYFRDIKIINQSELLKQLTQRMRNDLKENGMIYSDIQWKQVCEILSKKQVTGFFENFAFYNPKDEVLYVNEKMITKYPEKIIPVCTHELSEKLLSTYLSSHLEAPTQALVKAYIEAKKTNNTKKFHELLNTYIDIIFKSVFKEGCCEAIALQTLRNMDYEIEVASLEKELQIGHSKCIDLLFDIDNARSGKRIKKDQMRLQHDRRRVQAIDEEKLIKEVLRGSQIIKGLSYYLGYPLATAVLEKYGIKGVKLALEKHPPLKAQYFASPQAYLTQLEKLATVIEQRR
ncbi:MAG: hypothetical protein QMD13_06315 [Candidatus Bathyarchaeia archaeon]|nr:hypothetical protein [Candidatus Bathyarchaeia archaeon]